ncbi:hypothetical protein CVT24_010303 [Panaeolus cyanescens]|uniref:Amino acid permease/ SLC12A domain-containing protein n=1 Tax=Panaeolus cyanescens TaxID=181874 RepID=A0A409YQB6_9AGAR|nr:hypothetical protein CVT24_010303 [Panaeolus cyanescens]
MFAKLTAIVSVFLVSATMVLAVPQGGGLVCANDAGVTTSFALLSLGLVTDVLILNVALVHAEIGYMPSWIHLLRSYHPWRWWKLPQVEPRPGLYFLNAFIRNLSSGSGDSFTLGRSV